MFSPGRRKNIAAKQPSWNYQRMLKLSAHAEIISPGWNYQPTLKISAQADNISLKLDNVKRALLTWCWYGFLMQVVTIYMGGYELIVRNDSPDTASGKLWPGAPLPATPLDALASSNSLLPWCSGLVQLPPPLKTHWTRPTPSSPWHIGLALAGVGRGRGRPAAFHAPGRGVSGAPGRAPARVQVPKILVKICSTCGKGRVMLILTEDPYYIELARRLYPVTCSGIYLELQLIRKKPQDYLLV